MGQSSEFDVLELLKNAPHFEMPIDAEHRVLAALRSDKSDRQQFVGRKHRYSGILQTGAAVIAVAILGAGLWTYRGHTANHRTVPPSTATTSNASKSQQVHNTSFVVPQESAILPGYKIIFQYQTTNGSTPQYRFYEGVNSLTGYQVFEAPIPSDQTLSMMTPSKSDQYGEVTTVTHQGISVTILKSKLMTRRQWNYYFVANGLWFEVESEGSNQTNDWKLIDSLTTNPQPVPSNLSAIPFCNFRCVVNGCKVQQRALGGLSY